MRSRGARAAVRPDAPPAKTLDQEIEELVAYMLFADESPLRAPVKGSSVLRYDPSGAAAQAYRDLAKEVLDGAQARDHA